MANAENTIQFECVRPIEEHARLVMEWRNDLQTLAMSFHTSPKVWPAFYHEFVDNYFTFPELPPLFALANGQRVAFLRFRPVPHPEDQSRRCCDISINVAPEWRNKGIGQQILREAQSWIAQQGYDDLYAEVKIDNIISKKAFLHAGFRQLDDDIKIIFDTGENSPIHRFLATVTEKKQHDGHVFIIAEAGSNWRMGSPSKDLVMAKLLIKLAAEAGADAIKFQVYRPETVYVANAGTSDYLSDAGIKEDIRDIFANLSMPYEMIPELADECRKCNILFMATAFSPADFAAIDPFVPIHKIASYEIGHIHLLELAAKSKKPIFMSTGAANEDEIAWSVNFLKSHHCGPLSLLQCCACYPAKPSTLNLRAIKWLKERFKVNVGFSDHSRNPIIAPIAAVALGATIIEKHFTLDNSLPGPDHAFAITPNELKDMVHAIRQTQLMLGSSIKIVDESEQELRSYSRRGLQALCDINIGDIFQENKNFAILRPGKQSLGVHPGLLSEIIGKPSKRHIPAGSGLQRGDW